MLSLDFQTHFSELEDPRVTNHNTRHKFIDILVLAFISVLCGCDDWVETVSFCKSKKQLFKQFLALPHGIPSHDTFSRVFSLIDAQHFEELFIAWMSELFVKTKGEIIALDGKTIRSSRNKGLKGIHLVHAWACENSLTLGAMRVEDKTNEITIIPKLLKLLNIAHCTVTLDAMGCQRAIAETIIHNKANYVLHVKENQHELKTEIESAFKFLEMRPDLTHWDSGVQEESGHGRLETRQYISIPVLEHANIHPDWTGIQSATKVIRTRTIQDQVSHEICYFISSHPYHSPTIKKAIRAHWRVENNLHWQLDVSFNEDHSRARMKNEAQNLALLRRISMTYLKKDTQSKVGIKCKRKKAGWDDQYLLDIITGLYSQDHCKKKLTTERDS
jgi:predicted transposase YbfD/YdcC